MYKIVCSDKIEFRVAAREIETEVVNLKNQGWVEQGGVSISTIKVGCHTYYTLAQAMVKKDE